MMLLRPLILLFVVAIPAFARPYPVQWVWAGSESNRIQNAWQSLSPERVNIEISPDGGSNWFVRATGVPSQTGTNTYIVDLPDIPASTTSKARLRVSATRRLYNDHYAHSDTFTIAGIYFTPAPAQITNGVPAIVRWTACGAGDYVQLGYRYPPHEGWIPVSVLASVDSDMGSSTNMATVTISTEGDYSGPAEIVLQSLSDPLNNRIMQVEVVNAQEQ